MATLNITTLVLQPRTTHTHTVVFLHGRGDNASDFSNSLIKLRDSKNRTLFDALPSFRWIFPQAPMRRCLSNGETIPQWFDVYDVTRFTTREEVQQPGLREMVPEITQILAREANILAGRWDRVVLAGISMGAGTSVHTLFNLQVPQAGGGRLGAFLSFSARCPFDGRSLDDVRRVLSLGNVPSNEDTIRKTPMLLEHCVDDGLVFIENGRNLRDTLKRYGAKVTWKEYASGDHWFNAPKGMDDAIQFLESVLDVPQGQEVSGADSDVEMT